MCSEEYSDLGMRRLACAIYKYAADDYLICAKAAKRAKARAKALSSMGLPESHAEMLSLADTAEYAEIQMKSLAAWFHAPALAIIAPEMDPDAVIEALDKKANAYEASEKDAVKYAKRVISGRKKRRWPKKNLI